MIPWPKKISNSLIFWLFVSLLLTIVILINGISIFPSSSYQRLSQNPFITRTDIGKENFWQEDILLPIISFFAKWNTPLKFNTFCFVIIIAAYLLFAGLMFNRFGLKLGIICTTILITSSITTVLLTWIGSTDCLTFALTIPILFTSSYFIIFFLALFGVTNHIIFLIASIEILLLRWISKDKIKIIHIFLAIMGGAIGYGIVNAFIAFNHIHVYSKFDFIVSKGLNGWVGKNMMNLPLTIFSLLNIQWLLILICLIMFFKKDKLYYSSVVALLILNYIISFFTLDTTRIFSLISWGILLEVIFHSYQLKYV